MIVLAFDSPPAAIPMIRLFAATFSLLASPADDNVCCKCGVIISVVKPESIIKSNGPCPLIFNWITTYSLPNPAWGKRSLVIGKSATSPPVDIAGDAAAFAADIAEPAAPVPSNAPLAIPPNKSRRGIEQRHVVVVPAVVVEVAKVVVVVGNVLVQVAEDEGTLT